MSTKKSVVIGLDNEILRLLSLIAETETTTAWHKVYIDRVDTLIKMRNSVLLTPDSRPKSIFENPPVLVSETRPQTNTSKVVCETRTQTLGGDILIRIDFEDGTWHDFFESKPEKITQLSKEKYHVPVSEDVIGRNTTLLTDLIGENGSGLSFTTWLTTLIQKKRLGIAYVRYVVFMTDFGKLYFPKEYRKWFEARDFFEPYTGPFPNLEDLEGVVDDNPQHAAAIMKALNDLIKVKAKPPMEFNGDAETGYTKLLAEILKCGEFSSVDIWKKKLAGVAKQVLKKGSWFTTVF